MYTRKQRLVKASEFTTILRLRPIYRTAHFVMYARRNGLLTPRLGVMVAKRMVPLAVTRNTIKRLIRESFRQAPLRAMDYVIRLVAPVKSKNTMMTKSQLKT